VNLILIALVFITVMVNSKAGLIFAIISGLILDFYSPFSFGIYLTALIIPVFIITNLFKKLLARKTIYTLIAAALTSTVIFQIAVLLISNLLFWFNWNEINYTLNIEYLYTLLRQLITHTIIISILFIITNFLSEKLKSKFLISERI